MEETKDKKKTGIDDSLEEECCSCTKKTMHCRNDIKQEIEKEIAKEKKEDSKETKTENKETKELICLLQRTQAEFENYRKRVDRDKQAFCEASNKDLILKILPILDNFDLALKNIKEKNQFVEGMELIYSQLLSILENEGIRQIETVGKKFDPYLHEALMQERSEEEENTVIEEFQKGYYLKDKVIRHSKVKVSKR